VIYPTSEELRQRAQAIRAEIDALRAQASADVANGAEPTAQRKKLARVAALTAELERVSCCSSKARSSSSWTRF
jgi:uncharacterized small protein (DUF1192 family)